MLYRTFIVALLLGIVSCGRNQKISDDAASTEPHPRAVSDSGNKEGQTGKLTDFVTLTDSQVRNGGIETAIPTSGNLYATLPVSGSIDVPPRNIISVSFPFGGYLKSTRLMPGMSLRKGEVIGVMEDQSLVQLQQDYLVAAARLRFLQQDFERQKLLQENNVNSAKSLQQVQADYSSQKAIVSGYAQKLRLIHINPAVLTEATISSSVPIYSPINGFVSAVNVNIGKFVNPTDVLFELINPEDLHVALVVFEKDMAKVRIGQKVKVSMVDEPGKEYLCEIILVTRNVNQDRTGLVHCHFEKRPASLLPGMFLNGKIMLSETAATTVPEDAVVRVGNNEFVLQQEQTNQFRLVPVRTGIRDGGQVQLIDSTGGIAEKPVIIKNAYAVLSKMKNTE